MAKPMASDTRENRHGLRFVADAMLGDVVRWLRIMGYDSLYVGDSGDEVILREASERVLLTADEELHSRAVKQGIEAHLVSGATFAEKMHGVVRRYGLSARMRGTRCTACNGLLARASADEVEASSDTLPTGVEEFWACADCGKLYWRGSHWKSIERTLLEIG
jgi:uncharacterized protein with PIN domain